MSSGALCFHLVLWTDVVTAVACLCESAPIVAKFVLQWGSQYVRVTSDEGRKLLSIAQAMLQLLFLPQFQPILLPKYVVELVVLLVYGETCPLFAADTQSEFRRLRQMVLRALPLRLSMTSLRAALGQTTASSSAVTLKPFKQLCGQLLSQLLMEEGGVMTTIEMLLGSVEEGNTQARVQVATLVSVQVFPTLLMTKH